MAACKLLEALVDLQQSGCSLRVKNFPLQKKVYRSAFRECGTLLGLKSPKFHANTQVKLAGGFPKIEFLKCGTFK